MPSDEKMERLLNLVLALLGTRRYLKKSELLEQIPGYEGAIDSRERMFERDKDELRRIGIPIETHQIDPLFDDEVGYRIPKEKFQSRIPWLSASELVVSSIALKLVSHLGLSDKVQRTLTKLQANADQGDSILNRIIPFDSLKNIQIQSSLPTLIESIRKKHSISFLYERDMDGARSVRHVYPLQIRFTDEDWFLKAWDYDRDGIRNFLVDNIQEVRAFEISQAIDPEMISNTHELKKPTEIKLKVPSESIPLFEMEGGYIVDQNESNATMTFHTFNIDRFLRIAISISSQIEVREPKLVAEEFKNLLTRLRNAI